MVDSRESFIDVAHNQVKHHEAAGSPEYVDALFKAMEAGQIFQVAILRNRQNPNVIDSIQFNGFDPSKKPPYQKIIGINPDNLIHVVGWQNLQELRATSTADDWQNALNSCFSDGGYGFQNIPVVNVIKGYGRPEWKSSPKFSRQIRLEAVQDETDRTNLTEVFNSSHSPIEITFKTNQPHDQHAVDITFGTHRRTISVAPESLKTLLHMTDSDPVHNADWFPGQLAQSLRNYKHGYYPLDIYLRKDGRLVNPFLQQTRRPIRIDRSRYTRTNYPDSSHAPAKADNVTVPDYITSFLGQELSEDEKGQFSAQAEAARFAETERDRTLSRPQAQKSPSPEDSDIQYTHLLRKYDSVRPNHREKTSLDYGRSLRYRERRSPLENYRGLIIHLKKLAGNKKTNRITLTQAKQMLYDPSRTPAEVAFLRDRIFLDGVNKFSRLAKMPQSSLDDYLNSTQNARAEETVHALIDQHPQLQPYLEDLLYRLHVNSPTETKRFAGIREKADRLVAFASIHEILGSGIMRAIKAELNPDDMSILAALDQLTFTVTNADPKKLLKTINDEVDRFSKFVRQRTNVLKFSDLLDGITAIQANYGHKIQASAQLEELKKALIGMFHLDEADDEPMISADRALGQLKKYALENNGRLDKESHATQKASYETKQEISRRTHQTSATKGKKAYIGKPVPGWVHREFKNDSSSPTPRRSPHVPDVKSDAVKQTTISMSTPAGLPIETFKVKPTTDHHARFDIMPTDLEVQETSANQRSTILGKMVPPDVDLKIWPDYKKNPPPDWWDDVDDTAKQAYSILKHMGKHPLRWQGNEPAPDWFSDAPDWKKPILNILAESQLLTHGNLSQVTNVSETIAAFIDRRTDKPRYARSRRDKPRRVHTGYVPSYAKGKGRISR